MKFLTIIGSAVSALPDCRDDLVATFQNFFPLLLKLRQNKLECYSLFSIFALSASEWNDWGNVRRLDSNPSSLN
jgi:hypothetical protein